MSGVDAIIHTAIERSVRGVNKDREAIETLLAALGHRPAAVSPTFIYTSAAWVLGATTRPVDESAPLDPAEYSAWRPAHEQLVLDAGTNGVRTLVVRPGIVYGGSRGIVSDLLKDALNGLVRVVGPGKNRWPCIYDRDLGELYVRILESPSAAGVIHATDETDERVSDIAEAIAAHVPQRPDIRHVPMTEARKKLGTKADALALDQKVRSPKARALGWAPTRTGVINSVPRLVEEFRNAQRER